MPYTDGQSPSQVYNLTKAAFGIKKESDIAEPGNTDSPTHIWKAQKYFLLFPLLPKAFCLYCILQGMNSLYHQQNKDYPQMQVLAFSFQCAISFRVLLVPMPRSAH